MSLDHAARYVSAMTYDTAVGQPSVGFDYHEQVQHVGMTLRALADLGGRVTRVRFLSEGPLCDLSYVHGVTPDGTLHALVGVDFPSLTPKRLRKARLIEWAKREGVYAKGVGLLDEGNWSTL